MFLLLLKFICSSTCTRTIAGQQQHETVTATTTTTQSNLHKLLSVQDVIFPIQQLHVNTSSENMNSFQVWVSVCTSSEKLTELFTSSETGGGYIWSQCALHLTSWPSCSLHLKTWHNSALCHEMSLLGGYIWSQCALHLKSWPSCSLHLKTWPNCNDHFKWALTEDMAQTILDLLSLTVSNGGIILSVHFIWKYELISGLTLASQKVFSYYIRKT